MLELITKVLTRLEVGPQTYCVALAVALSAHCPDGKEIYADLAAVYELAEKMGVERNVTHTLVKYVGEELEVDIRVGLA